MELNDIFIYLLTKIITSNKLTRNLAVNQLSSLVKKRYLEDNDGFTKEGKMVRYYAVYSMLISFLRNIDKGIISKKVANKFIQTLVKGVMLKKNTKEAINKYEKKYGERPPSLMTLSPSKRCNLNCIGCYASSTAANTETLDWDIVTKLLQDTYDNMGMRFFVISGGEPLMYESQGKGILDLAEKFNDCFFLMYTNGTLITKDVAKRMAQLGNITPAISVEGYEEETDYRRGKGIFNKIKEAMANLKEEGVPFGVSVTSTKDNAHLLMEDEFYRYYFDEVGATYMWLFQYMPIGRKITTELMVTPEQRVGMFKQWLYQLKNKHRFCADFWNSAILSSGCISSGRTGGYFYVDWNGNIMPCVFVPYYKDNIKDLYSKGKSIGDGMQSDLFKHGREWIKNYNGGYNKKMKNLLMPCFIRDHHANFVKIVKETNANPEDKAAEQALNDEEYHRILIEFDKELEGLTNELWEKTYVDPDFKVKKENSKEKK